MSRIVAFSPVQKLARESQPQTSSNASTLPEGEWKIMAAAAQYPGGANRETLTVLTGNKRSSRDAYVQRLHGKGLIETSGDKLIATATRVMSLGSNFEPLPTGEALQGYWTSQLPDGERSTLEVLLER